MVGRWKITPVLLLLIPIAACGGGGEAATGIASGLEITSPEQGAKVSTPFTLKLSTNVELGKPNREHYVQLYYDGVKGPIATNETFEVSKMQGDPGVHSIFAELRTKEGEWTGANDEVRFTVTKGKGG